MKKLFIYELFAHLINKSSAEIRMFFYLLKLKYIVMFLNIIRRFADLREKYIYIVLQHLQTSYGNICYNLVYARSSKTNETFLKCYTLGTNLYLHQKYQEKCDFYFAKVTFLTPFDIFVDLMQLRLSLFFGHLQRENTILKRP